MLIKQSIYDSIFPFTVFRFEKCVVRIKHFNWRETRLPKTVVCIYMREYLYTIYLINHLQTGSRSCRRQIRRPVIRCFRRHSCSGHQIPGLRLKY